MDTVLLVLIFLAVLTNDHNPVWRKIVELYRKLIKAVNGVQKLPEKWKQPLDDFIRALAKNLITDNSTTDY